VVSSGTIGQATAVKIRIGFGYNTALTPDHDSFAHVVDELERLRFDSLWFTERLNAPTLDPLVAMSAAAARTRRLKIGTSVMVLPGRNPVVLAKALASLSRLSDGRLLPAMGLGVANAAEHQAFQVRREDRAPWFDEALPLMRRLWSGEVVDHPGPRFPLQGVQVLPTPVGGHLDVWLGGAAPAELRRAGRLGDGWLPSFTTPTQVREGILVVQRAAAAAGREIDPEHFGVLVPYVHGPVPDQLAAVVRLRAPDADVADVVATGTAGLRERIERFVTVGASKFVLFPFDQPPDWTEELELLAAELAPLET
jgi:probable F420-dependent oxidoreductase